MKCGQCNRRMIDRAPEALLYGIKESTGELETFDGTICGLCLTQAGYLSLNYVCRLLVECVTGVSA